MLASRPLSTEDSDDPASEGAPEDNPNVNQPLFRGLPKKTYFACLLLLSAATSGGLIAGIGPLQAALVREGYFDDYDAVTSVFSGAFQIMTVREKKMGSSWLLWNSLGCC